MASGLAFTTKDLPRGFESHSSHPPKRVTTPSKHDTSLLGVIFANRNMGATRFPGLAGREKNETFVRAELGKFFYCNFFAVVLGTVSTVLAPNRLLGSLISEVFGISTALSSQSFTRHTNHFEKSLFFAHHPRRRKKCLGNPRRKVKNNLYSLPYSLSLSFAHSLGSTPPPSPPSHVL